jgi:hypothetical protein
MIEMTLDIFRKLPDGQPMWIKAVDGFNEAKRQVSELAKLSPGDYFIFDTRTGGTFTPRELITLVGEPPLSESGGSASA